MTDPVIKKQNLEVRQIFKQLREKYDIQKSKNVEFLINVHQVRSPLVILNDSNLPLISLDVILNFFCFQLCGILKGGHITTCRTGKDRSGMSVTLQECCILRNNHKLDDNAFMTALATLRRLVHNWELYNIIMMPLIINFSY